MEFDTGQFRLAFSGYIGSFETDCSAKAHHPMGEPFSSFPNDFTGSTSMDYSNLISRQLLNLGLSDAPGLSICSKATLHSRSWLGEGRHPGVQEPWHVLKHYIGT